MRSFLWLRFGLRSQYSSQSVITDVATDYLILSVWCERGDSNPHGIAHRILNPARLPVPPLSPAMRFLWMMQYCPAMKYARPAEECQSGGRSGQPLHPHHGHIVFVGGVACMGADLHLDLVDDACQGESHRLFQAFLQGFFAHQLTLFVHHL